MNRPAVPLVRELVLLGGGHTHALVLKAWGMKPVPGARLTLVNPGPAAPYSGMLPGHIAGHYTREDLRIDLVRLARFSGARLILGRATGINRAAGRVMIDGRGPVAYDLLSIDIGVTSEMPALPGFADHGVPAKPLDVFADRWETLCLGSGKVRVVVIGGGVAGTELAMAAAHRMRRFGRPVQVTLIEQGRILSGLPPMAERRLRKALAQNGIALCEGARVARVTATGVDLADGTTIPSDFTIGAAGARPHDWLAETGLHLTDGYVTVDEHLRSVTDPAIYAAGDCAHLSHAPRPKAGVFAVRAAPVLAHNLRADLIGAQRRAFRPQKDFLKLISLGRQSALAEKAGFALAGPALWRWKDRIDRGFMDRFRHFPPMDRPLLPKGAARGVGAAMGPKPLCGGCGAKLGRGVLDTALAALPAGRDDVLSRPGDDAAVLQLGEVRQVVTTDHLRAFTGDPALMARVAAVHAMGDIWAMGAAPQAALATVILPRMRPGMQGAWLTEIMEAAAEVFAAEGAEIVGGHSSAGEDLTIGFTVTGLLDGDPVTLAGARPGDALILTRGIGTGVILAAEMDLKAQGGDVAHAWAQMARPQGDAAALLRGEAHAMTDVTGFGLAGHLWNICEASGVAARLVLEDVPILPGAEELAARGIRSTLFPENAAALDGRMTGGEGPRADLMLDPQTAGGFLAAVPKGKAAGLVTRLRAMGHEAAVIGAVEKGAPAITLA